VTGVALALVAIVNWWLVAEEGPSAAKVIAAVVATVAAVIQLAVRVRDPAEKEGNSERRPD